MTTPNQLAAWAAGPHEQERLRADNERLTDLVLRLAERIYLAHEVIGRLAERKEVRGT